MYDRALVPFWTEAFGSVGLPSHGSSVFDGGSPVDKIEFQLMIRHEVPNCL